MNYILYICGYNNKDMKLIDLKAGDLVVLHPSFREAEIVTITSVTNTTIVVGCSKFNNITGGLKGRDKYSTTRISIATPEKINEIKAKEHNQLTEVFALLSTFYKSSL